MQTITEFKFDSLDKSISKAFIKLHNEVYCELNELKSYCIEQDSKDYLDIFLNEFKSLSPTMSCVDTVLCASKLKIETIYKDLVPQNIPNEIFKFSTLKKLSFVEEVYNNKKSLSKKVKPSKKDLAGIKKCNDLIASVINLKQVLGKIFDYDKNRKHLLTYYESIDLNVCLYCSAQYTTLYRSQSKKQFYLKGNLDHIHAKSEFPFFSLSINNLVPVCAHCNQRKGKYSFNYNPFDPEHAHTFNFEDCLDFDVKEGKVKLENLSQMKIDFDSTTNCKLVDKLDLLDLYRKFDKNAETTVSRFRNYYSRGYGESISKSFKTKEGISALEYFVSEIPLTDSNVLKHPLTKFKKDLFESLKSKINDEL